MHVKIEDLPTAVQNALRAHGYHRKDISVEESESYTPQGPGGQGSRSVCTVVNCITGERKTEIGSWGGANMFTQNSVDTDSKTYPIPPNCAVIKGSIGEKAWLYVYVAPGMTIGLLPPAVEMSDDEKRALAVIRGIRGGHRADYFSRHRLGAYGGENAHVQRLKALGFVTVNRGGAIAVTTEGRNVDLPRKIGDDYVP